MSSQPRTLLGGGNLVTFGDSVSSQLCSDTMSCLLHAQHVADTKYDRHNQWASWVGLYQTTISLTGGRASDSLRPITMEIRSAPELRSLPAHLRGSVSATSRELQRLMDQSIHTLLQSDQSRYFLMPWFASAQDNTMQIVPCEASGGDAVDILVCGLLMKTRMLAVSGLFGKIAVMRVEGAGSVFTLSEAQYAPYRERIEAYLAKRAIAEMVRL